MTMMTIAAAAAIRTQGTDCDGPVDGGVVGEAGTDGMDVGTEDGEAVTAAEPAVALLTPTEVSADEP